MSLGYQDKVKSLDFTKFRWTALYSGKKVKEVDLFTERSTKDIDPEKLIGFVLTNHIKEYLLDIESGHIIYTDHLDRLKRTVLCPCGKSEGPFRAIFWRDIGGNFSLGKGIKTDSIYVINYLGIISKDGKFSKAIGFDDKYGIMDLLDPIKESYHVHAIRPRGDI